MFLSTLLSAGLLQQKYFQINDKILPQQIVSNHLFLNKNNKIVQNIKLPNFNNTIIPDSNYRIDSSIDRVNSSVNRINSNVENINNSLNLNINNSTYNISHPDFPVINPFNRIKDPENIVPNLQQNNTYIHRVQKAENLCMNNVSDFKSKNIFEIYNSITDNNSLNNKIGIENNLDINAEIQSLINLNSEEKLLFIKNMVDNNCNREASILLNSLEEKTFDPLKFLYLKAIIYKNLYEYDKALEFYSKILDIFPHYALAYNDVALIHIKKGNYDLAIDNARLAIKYDSTMESARLNLNYAISYKKNNIYSNKSTQIYPVGIDNVEIAKATVKIISANQNNEENSGTGYIFKQEGAFIYIVTNRHVLTEKIINPLKEEYSKITSINISVFNELENNSVYSNTYTLSSVEKIKIYSDLDIAVIKLKVGNDKFNTLKASLILPKIFDDLKIVGMPSGKLKILSAKMGGFSEDKFIVKNDLIDSGFSGGAVINKSSEVIGICTRKGDRLCLAYPLKLILEKVQILN
jgi:tetratricopeptide (TPR) repeat protein